MQLNTPGKQDGGFWLYVDGRLVIQRSDVFYRDVPPAGTSAKPTASASPTTTSTSDNGGGGILDPLLGGIFRRTVVQEAPRDVRPLLLPAPTGEGGLLLATDAREWVVQLPPAAADPAPSTVTTTSTVSTTVTVYPTMAPGSEQTAPRTTPIGFAGIFFR